MEIFKDSKIIWGYLRKYKGKVYFIASVALVSSAIAAVIPYLYGRLVDIAVSENSTLKLIGAILLLWLFLSLLSEWLGRFVWKKEFDVAIDSRNSLLIEAGGHLLNLPLKFHKDKKMGEIIQRVDRGADHIERIIDDVIFEIGPNFLTVAVSLMITSFVEWRLTLLLLFVLIVYSVVSIWKTKPIIKAQRKLHRSFERAYGDLYDSILNTQTVKSFTSEKLEKRKMKRNFKDRAGRQYRSFVGLWRKLEAWQKTIFSFGFVSIFGGAIFFLREGVITPGQLVMFVGYISLTYAPFSRVANNYRQTRTGLVAIRRVEALLKTKSEPYQKNKTELKNIKGRVEFKNISFGYQDKKKIVKDISFKVKPGQMVALVGESGVGKTTLVDLVSRYYIPQKGRILIDDKDIADVSLESLRKNIAIVPQEVTLFNDTIKNNIRYGRPKANEKEIIQASKAAHVDEFIQKFDKKYEQLVGERGIKLSTGQKQRVAIARALLRDPKILILDEATSSLDSATEKLVQDALAYLIKGRTTFVIAHRLSTIQKADLILVLEKGRIIEEGDHQELISKGGVYKKLSKLQSTMVK